MEDDHDLKEAGAESQAQEFRATSDRPSNADRIEEYFEDSLEDDNPLQAVLGAGTADLMHVRSRLAESLKAELSTGQMALEE